MQSISGVSGHHDMQALTGTERTSAAKRTEDEGRQEKTEKVQNAVEYRHETPESPGRYWVKPTEGGAAIAFSRPTTASAESKLSDLMRSDAPSSGPDSETEAKRTLSSNEAAPADATPKSQAAAPSRPESDEPTPAKDEPKKEESITRCSTDDVDREIEQLRKRVAQLEQQAGTAASEEDKAKAQQDLDAAKRELAQKDNDGYRRQRAQFTALG